MNLLHYGLQRSGTNFLAALLVRNYRVRFLNRDEDRGSPLQKHFRLYDQKDLVPEPRYRNDVRIADLAALEKLLAMPPHFYLVISKDPYSWYLSYVKWASKCQWPPVRHHYIEEYNLFYGKWLALSAHTDRINFVRYADLLRDSAGELRRLQARMNLQQRWHAWLTGRLPLPAVPQSAAFANERRHYYLDEKYLADYSGDELGRLNERLDPLVVRDLGYQLRR